jgi:hypothetical protein
MNVTCNYGIALIILIAIIAAILLIPYNMLFRRYCGRIAELEGRTEEFNSLSSLEGGGNFFEIEHAGKIVFRYYLRFGDEKLTKMGDNLLMLGISGLLAVILLLCAIVFVKTVACGA